MTGDRLEIAPMPRERRDSPRPRITAADADRLVRLARDAVSQLDDEAGYGKFKEFLEEHGVKKGDNRRIGPTTTQGVRLLRRAYEVFGKKLRQLLVQVGFAKTVLLAKLSNAKQRVKSKKTKNSKDSKKTEKIADTIKFKLAAGTVTLREITKRELEQYIRGAKRRRGHRKDPVLGPGHVFAVPRDVVAVHRFLVASLKSLLPRGEGVRPRYKVTTPKEGETPLPEAMLRGHVEQLAQVIEVYRLVVLELLKPKALAAPGRTVLVGERGAEKRGVNSKAGDKNLIEALKLLAKTMPTTKVADNTAKVTSPRGPRRKKTPPETAKRS